MFIRLVSSEIDERSHVAAGLFCAASKLRWTDELPDYEFDALSELRDWFAIHLESPFDHLPRADRYEKAVCWFKPTAREQLARAWEMITILERTTFRFGQSGRGRPDTFTMKTKHKFLQNPLMM